MFLEFRVQVLCVSMLQFLFFFFCNSTYPKVQTVTVRGALKGSLGRGALRLRQKPFISLNPVYDKKPHLVTLIHTVFPYRIEYTQFFKLRTWNV